MKTNYFYSILIFFTCLVGNVLYFRHEIVHYLDHFSIEKAQQKFGSNKLSFEQENKIRHIADEMKVKDTFMVRKMNHKALITFGYHNAFVYFFQFLNCIPLNNVPILFVSEGFFEDLSNEEQRFLIAHELIHIQEHHTQYLNLIVYFILLLITILGCLIKKKFVRFIQPYFSLKRQVLFSNIIFFFLIYIILLIPLIGSSAYRKHIEFTADYRALTSLKEFDGAIKLIKRWNEEFKVPMHNVGYGIFASHPSCHDRITYILHLKNNYKEKIL